MDKKRILAGVLLIAIALSLTGNALAAPPTVTTDEAVYVNLDYYGVPEDTRIVKGVSLNGESAFTDYGAYAEVHNMSTYDQPVISDGAVSWTLENPEKQRFYYECIPSEAGQMPWTFDVSYKLDGVPAKAEDCAGASGLVEITVHAIPNTQADPYYQNNMTLMVMTGIDMDETLSIDAPGAQIQSLGAYKLVVFLGLPGEENTYTIRIGSTAFESSGVFMMMAPATMSQLDRISDFRDAKNKVSDASDDLNAGLNDLLDTVSSMQSGLSVMSAGIAGLDDVRRQLIDARSTLDPDTDQTLEALQKLAEEMGSMVPELMQTQENLVRIQSSTNTILDIITDSQADIAVYRESLAQVKKSLRSVTGMLNDIESKTYDENEMKRILVSMRNAMQDLSSSSLSLSDSLSSLEMSLSSLSGFVSDPVLGAILSSNAVASLLDDTREMLDAMAALGDTGDSMAALADSYLDIMEKHQGDMSSLTESMAALTAQADSTLVMVDDILNELPNLQESLNLTIPVLNSLLDKTASLLVTTQETLTSTHQMMTDLQDTMRAVREQADAHTAQSIDGLLDMMQKALNSSGTTDSLQTATNSIHGVIKNEVDDLESDTNVLNMDNSLALRSFTSPDNPSPASLQFILRTQEISVEAIEAALPPQPAPEPESVFDRIINVFRKLFSAITSVFS